MKEEKLTYDEQFNVPITLEVSNFTCEYSGCGSHEMLIEARMNLENVQKLFDRIKEIKGINP
jgi:hypothetical protein